MFIIDAHLDLAMNAMEWNRDLTIPLSEINKREKNLKDKPDRSKATVSLDELRKGNIGIVVATQIARYVKPNSSIPGWNSPYQAWSQTQAQLSWYKEMEAIGQMRMIKNKNDLKQHLFKWNNNDKTIGYILSLEGADSIVNLDYLDIAYNNGLRAIGPAHYKEGRYAFGTDSNKKMDKIGLDLIKKIDKLGMILDTSHLCDKAFWQAIDIFSGNLWASHNNCRKFVNHNRQYSDEQIKAIIQKKGVIGVVFDAWMLVPNWERGISTPKENNCSLENVIDNIDHICNIAGNTNHVGIGSDLDGCFGTEQCPYDLKTIKDLNKLIPKLKKRGFTNIDIEKIMYKNWLDFLLNNLPNN